MQSVTSSKRGSLLCLNDFFNLFWGGEVGVYIPGCPETHFVDQAGLQSESSRTARTTQRNPVSKNKTTKNQNKTKPAKEPGFVTHTCDC